MNSSSTNISWSRTGNQELMPNKDKTLRNLAIIRNK